MKEGGKEYKGSEEGSEGRGLQEVEEVKERKEGPSDCTSGCLPAPANHLLSKNEIGKRGSGGARIKGAYRRGTCTG
jgi:hypothetical protein